MKPVLQSDIFYKIINQTSDPFFLLGTDLHIIMANRAFSRLTGIPNDSITSIELRTLLSDEDFIKLDKKFRNINPENPSFNNIFPAILKDGSVLVEEWHNEGIFDESGKLLYYYCINSSTAQNKKNGQNNIEADLVANTIIKASFPGFIISIGQKTSYISDKVYEILCIEPDEIPENCGLAEIFKLADPEFPEEPFIPDSYKSKAAYEIKFQTSSGYERWISLDCNLENYNGKNINLCLIEDITERKLAESETEKTRKTLASVMRYAKIGYWEKNLKSNLWIWSKEVYKIYGIKEGTQITDDIIKSFMSEEVIRERETRISQLFSSETGNSSQKFEYQILPKHSTPKWLSGEAYYENERLFGWTQDITEYKLIEDELRNARNKAEESERLKSAFLANMSHEIRTPLNAILGFSDLLTLDPTEEEKVKFKKIINQSSRLLLKIIDDILDISSIESGTMELSPEIIDAYAILDDVALLYSDLESEDIEFIVEKPEKPILLKADRERLKQVFINLINNAFKYTEHGTITVKCKKVNNSALFSVSDTGEGIPHETIGYIFERFYQIDHFSKGTGLGLAISRSIIERMGGKINAKSTPGKGSTFSFTLPID